MIEQVQGYISDAGRIDPGACHGRKGRASSDRAGVATSMLSLAQGLGYLGDHSRAEPLLHQALNIHQALNDRWSTILVWNELGILHLMLGKLASAKTFLLGDYSGCIKLDRHLPY
jgi:hypothetical protein